MRPLSMPVYGDNSIKTHMYI